MLNDYEVWYNWGVVLDVLEKYDKVVSFYDRVIKIYF